MVTDLPVGERREEQALIEEARQRQRRRHRWIGSLVVLAVVGAGSGLYLVNQGPRTRSTHTPTTTPRPTGTAICLTPSLVAKLGPGGAAAGTGYSQIDLQNRNQEPCVLTGYPSVSFLNSSGQQIGYVAGHANLTDQPITSVVLPADGYANMAVGISSPDNYPAALCDMETATTLRILPPRNKMPLLLSDHVAICTASPGQTLVTPFRAGISRTAVAS